MNQGWIGAVFGLTVWIVVAGFVFVARDWKLGVLLFLLAAVQVFGATLIGHRRGIGRLIALAGAIALCVFLAVDVAGEMPKLREFSYGVSPYWFLLVFPLLAIVTRNVARTNV